jgi:hypothetical protein
MGAVGLNWQVAGIAPESSGAAGASVSQLVQAMASFDGGSGAGETLNAASPNADTSQQTFLTTPQHT